jgi:hypothetical protein
MTIDEMISELEDASSLEGTELGEWWGMLCEMQNRVADFGSDAFRDAWHEAIREEHSRLKEEFELVEEVFTKSQKVKSLKSKETL